MYEVVVTRLLSVISWYYLAFVSVSMAMLGMTAGALFVQLRSHFFTEEQMPKRLWQAAFAMAISLPLALVTMQSIPIDVDFSLQMFYSFVLFSAVMAVPFFFSGVAICLALTRSKFPIGKVYSVDLFGAAAGSLCAVGLLELMDPSSAVFAVSALTFVSAAAWARYEGGGARTFRFIRYGLALAIVAAFNAASPSAFRPLWCKGQFNKRDALAAEVWNPISRIRAFLPIDAIQFSWGASPNAPKTKVNQMWLDIDDEAGTPLLRYTGNSGELGFLSQDVTSIAARLRAGGSAAIIGVGGGRDVLTAHHFGFKRIVGIELNRGIVDLVMRRFRRYGKLDTIPGFEIHNDEGRSYLSRTPEKFDVIQASMVDTWAATSAGAMTLSENALYTVDGWQIFYDHLKPGGLITFTRWNVPQERVQTRRLFALGWATLLSEGVRDPGANMALVAGGSVATILVSNAPLSTTDLDQIRTTCEALGFEILYLPGQQPIDADLRAVTRTQSIEELLKVKSGNDDFAPVFDSSPFFFNTLRKGGSGLRALASALMTKDWGTGGQRAVGFLVIFLLATLPLMALAIELPLTRWAASPGSSGYLLTGGIIYFVGIGLGFMLAEMGMMQQLSIFLGHPIYSLVVTLSGLILATGVGSLASEWLTLRSNSAARIPAIASGVILACYCALAGC